MLDRSSGNHDWLLESDNHGCQCKRLRCVLCVRYVACVACVRMETGLDASGHCVRFFTQRTQAPANRNARSKQPIMIATLLEQSLALLAFFVYATHASHATLALHALRALRTMRALRCVRCVRLNGNRALGGLAARSHASIAIEPNEYCINFAIIEI